MKKHKSINALFICLVAFISIFPMVLFYQNIQITKYSIPAICVFAVHVLYGLAAYFFRRKGNYLRFSPIFIRHFLFHFVEPDREQAFTKEYDQRFYRMLAVYCAVIPLYAPCIFLAGSASLMPLALIVFLLPQLVFIWAELRGVFHDVKKEQQKSLQQEEERKEQERREELGNYK